MAILRRLTGQSDWWAPSVVENWPGESFGLTTWSPPIETFQRGDEFAVRADLPGLDRKHINVEIEGDSLVIEGERTDERETTEDGYCHTERSYGRFCRVIPLPEGAIGDSVQATYKDGVLEVTMKAPPHESSRGRRVEVRDR